MKTTLQVIDLLYHEVAGINTGTSVNGLTGGVYKLERPVNSKKEDVVINSLSISAETIQECVANINIHVPDISIKIEGQTQYKADYQRLQELGAIYATPFEYAVISAMQVNIESQNIFEDPESNQHFFNIRLKVKVFN